MTLFASPDSRAGLVVGTLDLGLDQRRAQRRPPSRSSRVSVVISAANQLAQRVELPDLNVTPPYGDKPLLVKFREDAAHGLQLEPQEISDLRACHPELELRPRAAEGQKPLRKIDYKCHYAFLGTPVTEEQHYTVVAANFVTQGA